MVGSRSSSRKTTIRSLVATLVATAVFYLVLVIIPTASNVVSSPLVVTSQTGVTLPENSAPGTLVGTPFLVTGNLDGLVFAFSSSDTNDFEINPTDGQVSVKAGATFDFENTSVSSWELTVTATNANGESAEGKLSFVLTDVNEPPVFATATTTFTVDEHSTGDFGSPIVATDPDYTDQGLLVYSITNYGTNSAGAFGIRSNPAGQ